MMQLPDFSDLFRMSSERGKTCERRSDYHGTGVIKREQGTEGRLREEEKDVRKAAERVGTVEKFLKQLGRKTEAPTIKKEATIKEEGCKDKGWREKERPKHEREGADRGVKKEEEDGDQRREKRLRAIQEEPIEVFKPKSWLTIEMEKMKLDEGRDPTEEDIRAHLMLPNPAKIEDFKEPVKEWEVTDNLFEKKGYGFIFVPSSRSLKTQTECQGGGRISRIFCQRKR